MNNLRTRAILGAFLCTAAAVAWTGFARGQEESTVAQQAGPPPNTISFQMKPVTGDITNTDEQRINADADQDNWRLHGRTYDNQRFSPLTEITASNVKQLKPVALIQTGVANAMESTPIEIDGVLFVETASNVVQAYDAVTGEELWSYNPVLEFSSLCCGPQARGVAVAYGKVFVAQVDGNVVALDAKNGKVVWKTKKPDILPQPYHWYSFTGAPQVHNGLVVVGNGGAEWPTRGFVEALDAQTGALVWRFNDTAGPDDPNFKGAWEGDSWKIGGGSMWDAVAVDTKRGETPVSRVGTLEFMAPEIVKLPNRSFAELEAMRRARHAQYSNTVDVWALGVLTYECLFGRTPFAGSDTAHPDPAETVKRIENNILNRGVAFSSKVLDVSDRAKDFIKSALLKSVHERQSAESLHSRLRSRRNREQSSGPPTGRRMSVVGSVGSSAMQPARCTRRQKAPPAQAPPEISPHAASPPTAAASTSSRTAV